MKVGSSTFGLFASRNLAEQSRVISRALSRLSSGKRLQGPQEDSAAFSLSQRLESLFRSSVTRQGVMNMERSELEQTQSGLQVQTEIVQRMKELSVQASQSTLSAQERDAIRLELVSLRQEFDRVAGENSTLQYSSESFRRFEGSGQFNHQETMQENSTTGVAMGDLNADGHQDIAYLTTAGVEIRLGRGDGSFGSSQLYAVTLNADGDLKLKDLNNDNILDVVVGNTLGLYTFMGRGDGSFNPVTEIEVTGSEVNDFEFGDFNGDGNIDIAFVETSIGYLAMVLGNGDGSFQDPQYIRETGLENQFEVADFNNDGHDDLIVSVMSALVGYLGTGDGSFTTSGFTLPGFVYFSISDLSVSDADNDGNLDIFIADNGFDSDAVYRNNGGASFSSLTSTGSGGASIDFHDFNSDGLDDIIMMSGSLAIGLNRGGFTWGAFKANDDFQVIDAAFGDLDGDGISDIVTLSGGDLYIGLAQRDQMSGVSLLNVAEVDTATKLQRVLDETLASLMDQTSSAAIQLNQLDLQYDYESRMQEARESSYAAIMDPDIALETSNLVAAQIQQQAIIASLAQANLQQQVVLGLLRF